MAVIDLGSKNEVTKGRDQIFGCLVMIREPFIRILQKKMHGYYSWIGVLLNRFGHTWMKKKIAHFFQNFRIWQKFSFWIFRFILLIRIEKIII